MLIDPQYGNNFKLLTPVKATLILYLFKKWPYVSKAFNSGTRVPYENDVFRRYFWAAEAAERIFLRYVDGN